MRIFKKYLPVMIAKYVKTFFKGRIYIQGRGGYEFDQLAFNGFMATIAQDYKG